MSYHAALVRGRGQYGAYAVDHRRRNAGPATEVAHDLRHPVKIDSGKDDGISFAIDGGYRISGHHDRVVGELGGEIIAENHTVGVARLLEIGTLTKIDANEDVVRRALHPSIAADDQQSAYPGQMSRQAGSQDVAAAADAANRGADVGRRFQYGLDR